MKLEKSPKYGEVMEALLQLGDRVRGLTAAGLAAAARPEHRLGRPAVPPERLGGR